VGVSVGGIVGCGVSVAGTSVSVGGIGVSVGGNEVGDAAIGKAEGALAVGTSAGDVHAVTNRMMSTKPIIQCRDFFDFTGDPPFCGTKCQASPITQPPLNCHFQTTRRQKTPDARRGLSRARNGKSTSPNKKHLSLTRVRAKQQVLSPQFLNYRGRVRRNQLVRLSMAALKRAGHGRTN
jgi:hypothetical protein